MYSKFDKKYDFQNWLKRLCSNLAIKNIAKKIKRLFFLSWHNFCKLNIDLILVVRYNYVNEAHKTHTLSNRNEECISFSFIFFHLKKHHFKQNKINQFCHVFQLSLIYILIIILAFMFFFPQQLKLEKNYLSEYRKFNLNGYENIINFIFN